MRSWQISVLILSAVGAMTFAAASHAGARSQNHPDPAALMATAASRLRCRKGQFGPRPGCQAEPGLTAAETAAKRSARRCSISGRRQSDKAQIIRQLMKQSLSCRLNRCSSAYPCSCLRTFPRPSALASEAHPVAEYVDDYVDGAGPRRRRRVGRCRRKSEKQRARNAGTVG